MSAAVSSHQARPRMSPSPPSSFTPPRASRQPAPSPPPSPSPARVKGKGRALAGPAPSASFDQDLNYGGHSPSKKKMHASSSSTSLNRADRKSNGHASPDKAKAGSGGNVVREQKLKGDGGLAADSDDEENGWGWEEEHTWGENFWVTVQDIATAAIFYANPRTGQSSWEPPAGVYVLPIPPTGQWWQILDPARKNLPYYYHTLTRETRWTRPDTRLIIPFSAIQMSSLGAPPSKSFQRRRSASALATAAPSPDHLEPSSANHRKKASAPPSTTHNRGGIGGVQRSLAGAAAELKAESEGESPAGTPTVISRASSSGARTPEKGLGLAGLGRRLRERAISGPIPIEPTGRPPLERLKTDLKVRNIGQPSVDLGARTRMSPVKMGGDHGPVVVPATLNTKRFSTGDHPILPVDISSEIKAFSVKEYADRFFSTTHTQGVFLRKKVPVSVMLVWQKAAITTPLLTLSSSLKSTAVKCFKVIQRAMGERDRPVDVPTLSTSSSSSSSQSLSTAKNSPPPQLTDREVMLSEVRWMLSVGIAHLELRDEIYSQIVKQLTENPNLSCVFRGWELLSVLVVTFSPSKNYAEYLKAFVKTTARSPDQADEIGTRVQIMARHCLDRLASNKPPKGKAPTILEIESAMGAAFNPSVFGSTLAQTLEIQADLYPNDRVPIILPFLANGILALGGASTEGIFRVPGDGDGVAMLKDRIDRGQYQLNGIDDPHIAASLLKLWLRELQEPLIPPSKYNSALAVSSDPVAVCDLIRSLPQINRAVVVFTISFLQLLLAHQTETKMTEMNLATIFAPNLLRCPVDTLLAQPDFNPASDVPTQFINSGFERAFVLTLLRRLVAKEIDDDYIPEFGIPPSASSPPNPSPQRPRNGTA